MTRLDCTLSPAGVGGGPECVLLQDGTCRSYNGSMSPTTERFRRAVLVLLRFADRLSGTLRSSGGSLLGWITTGIQGRVPTSTGRFGKTQHPRCTKKNVNSIPMTNDAAINLTS